jgi:large repetitive protein
MAQMVTGSGPGDPPEVHLIESTGERVLLAYDPLFLGGVHVALGDVDGDGTADIVTGAGPGGGPHVRVFSGVDLSELASFFAFDPAFVGGVTVAAGDIDGDGRADIITGAGTGSPHVRVFSGADLSELASFFAYDTEFGGGVNVAAGDVDGDGLADIITGAGIGGGPDVKAFSGADLSELASFFAFDPAFAGGVSVAAGDLDGDGFADIIAGAGPGGGPDVRIVSGADLSELTSFFAYDPAFGGGVNVATGDLNGDGRTDLITGAGPGGGPHVRIFSGVDLSELDSFFVGTSASGVTVGSIGDAVGLRFTSATSTSFTVGSAGTFTVTTAGNPAPAITSSGALPAGVTFTDNGDGTATLAGTPAAGTSGAYALTFTAANGVATDAVQAFTLTINEGPVITSASSTTFALGAVNSFTVVASGFPFPSLVQGGATLPSGVTFVDNGDGTGTLSGTPAAGTLGNYALTFTAANGSGSAVQNFTLAVTGSPGFTSAATTTFTVGFAGTFTVTAIGAPAPALTVSGTLPAGVTFVDNGGGSGTLSGTPAAGTGGVYALTFTAANGVLPDGTQAFTLNVNQAPTITSAASTTFTVGTLGSFTVTTSGFPAATLTIGGVALPAGVSFVDNGNGTGTLTGTPGAGTGGTYAITFTAANTVGATAPQPFTLTVSQPPAITSAASTAFTVGVAGSFTVTTTGFPTPGITRTGVALPGGVTFTDNGDGTGTLSGTPAAGTAGSYAITFTAANGALPNAVQAFTLNVQQPPAITSANNTTFTVGTPGTFTVTTTGFPAPTVSQTGTLPSGVTFTPATKVLAGTATQTGAFPLVFTATNAVPPDATQNFTLNVVCPAITVNPAVMPDGLYLTAYGPVTFSQTGSTGSTITWSATGLPAGLTIASTTGIVSGTPTNTVLSGVVVITATDNFNCVGTRTTAITVRPTTDNENYIGGVGNTQYVTGAPFPLTPHVAFVDDVKTGDAGPGALSVTFPATSTNGGTIVEGTADGTFTYTPAVAFAGPTDTFTYTLTDGNGVTNTGTVTINLSNVVWYVNSAGGAGDGRSHSPFNTLNAAATPSGSTHIIYVHSGGATTTGNLAMDANQTVHGQGAAFTLNGLTIAAGTRPTLTGTVTLADNTTVRAVNFTPSGIAAMAASGVSFAQPVTIDQVNVTGGTSALSLTNVTAMATGAINVSNASFLNTSAAEVLISQGTIPVTLASTATISSNAGRSVDIQNRTGGTVTFNGAITDTGQGVFLNANTGSTINFTGGLSLSTTTNPGFTATGGGTVSATQNNTTIVNTINTTTGTALNVANTTVGASGLTFRSISANGAASGIVLNSTGATGSLSVTGTGSASSGGVIQFTTGAGISLTNTLHPQFAWMNIHDIGQNGIDGQQVTNFTLTNSTINNVGTAAAGQYNENNISFNDAGAFTSNSLSGTVTITNNTLTNARRHGIQIENGTGTIGNLTISNNVLTSSTSAAASLGTAILVLAQGSATLNAHVTTGTIATNTISNFPSGEGILVGGGSGNGSNNTSSTLGATGTPISITGNAINGGATRMGSNAIRVAFNGQVGVSNFSITNNGTAGSPITNIQGQGISAFMGGSVTGSTTITNNFIVANQTLAAGTQGLAVQIDDGPAALGTSAADYNVVITNNSVSAYEGNGIRAIARASLGKMDVTIQNNTVGTPILANRNGIRIDSGSAVGDVTVCLAISGNTSAGSGVNQGIGLRKQGTVAATNDFGIVGLSPSPTTGANAAARVATDNPAGNGVDIISGDNFTSCTITP